MRGKVWTARPMTVLADDAAVVALLMTVGTRYEYPDGVQPSQLAEKEWLSGEWRLIQREWYGHNVVRFSVPGQAWDVWWPAPNTAGDWYVNFQEPLHRTATGFDTLDHVLDLIVSGDGTSWRWKDVEDFRHAREVGILSNELARSIEREGQRIVASLEAGDFPWDTSWASRGR